MLINEMITSRPGARTSMHKSRTKSPIPSKAGAPSDLNRTGMNAVKFDMTKAPTELNELDERDIDIDAPLEAEEIDLPQMKQYVDDLLAKDEKNDIRFEEMEDRMMRVEQSTGVRD